MDDYIKSTNVQKKVFQALVTILFVFLCAKKIYFISVKQEILKRIFWDFSDDNGFIAGEAMFLLLVMHWDNESNI